MLKSLLLAALIGLGLTFSHTAFAQNEEQQEEDDPFGALGGILQDILKPQAPEEEAPAPEQAPPQAPPTAPPTAPTRTGDCGGSDCDGDGHLATAYGGDDCDDGDPNRYPGNAEVADAYHKDEDCDPFTFGAIDIDGDGFPGNGACNLLPDGSYRCGTDCDDNNYAIGPGSQICSGPNEVSVCVKRQSRYYGASEWENGEWQAFACESGCRAQINGTGVCQ